MIPQKSLVIYKNHPALVTGYEGEKINIKVPPDQSFKVREKDVELLHPGPCTLDDLEKGAPPPGTGVNVREVWELLAGDGSPVSLKELAELAYGAFNPGTAWAAWGQLRDGLYFTGDVSAIVARKAEAVLGDEKKREEKGKESGERASFLERLKKLPSKINEEERRFLQDVEALALGKTDKSRTMRDLGKGESPEEAHRLLLGSGAWTVWVNPHPDRYGLNREPAKLFSPAPLEPDRLDLTGLDAYAIDNPWSNDPDDALSLEGPDADGGYKLWVHVADPASSILPGSPADLEARGRGATLYLPEGPAHMLNPELLSVFAFRRGEETPALSIKIDLMPDLSFNGVDILPSVVRVTRLSYAQADDLIAGKADKASLPTLTALTNLAGRREKQRLDMGAVMITLPEVYIQVDLGRKQKFGSTSVQESYFEHEKPCENRVSVEPIAGYRSADMVRECMILAGEGAARWALQRQLPFPFVRQEEGDLPGQRLTGLAGAWQLRRCMRPRNLSVKPARHWGLGLDLYTQVTSPLRRYTDLLCHQQIRAWIGKGAYQGLKALGEEDVLFRVSAAEAAALAVSGAERASRAHWMAVYLSEKKDSVWEGVVLDRKGNRGTVIIPALGLETQLNLRGNEEPNAKVNLSLLSVKIPEGEAIFSIH